MPLILHTTFDEHLTFPIRSHFLRPSCYSHSRPYLDSNSSPSTIAASIVHSKLDYCNSLYYNLPKSQLNRLQQIQNCLARTVVKALMLKSLHWLKTNECIEYKLLSLTYKVLTTSRPDYISAQSYLCSVYRYRTRSSSLVTLARPSVSSSLQITNRSFGYASPYLWNQLPSSFRQPHSVHCPPGSPHSALINSSQSLSLLSSSITFSAFYYRLICLTYPSAHSLSGFIWTALAFFF